MNNLMYQLAFVLSLFTALMLWSALFLGGQIWFAKLFGSSPQEVRLGAGPPLISLSLTKRTRLRLCWIPIIGQIVWSRRMSSRQYLALAFGGAAPVLILLYFLTWLQLVDGVGVLLPGIYVKKAMENMPARGLRSGDIITRVGDDSVRYVADFQKILKNWKSGTKQVAVQRENALVITEISRPPATNGGPALLGILYEPNTRVMSLNPIVAAGAVPRMIGKLAFNLGNTITARRPAQPLGKRALLPVMIRAGTMLLLGYFLPLAGAPGWLAVLGLLQNALGAPSERTARRIENVFTWIMGALVVGMIGIAIVSALGWLPKITSGPLIPTPEWFPK